MNIYFDPVDHSYTSEVGKEYTPVTRICSITPRAVDFRALPNQDRIMKAASRGSVLHEELEAFVKTGAEGLFPSTEFFAREIHPKYKNWESEVLVYSDEEEGESYAGQIDLVCQDDKDDYHIWDLKSGGHETVDYQESLYSRAFCINRNIDPERVHLHCIDAKIETNIKIIDVRVIPADWLDNLLVCYKNGEAYKEPSMALSGMPPVALQKLEMLEAYVSSLESEIEFLNKQKETLKENLYAAMEEAKIEKFSYGCMKVSRIAPTETTTFNSKDFAKDHPELYQAYLKTSNRKGYVRISVKDVTEAK